MAVNPEQPGTGQGLDDALINKALAPVFVLVAGAVVAFLRSRNLSLNTEVLQSVLGLVASGAVLLVRNDRVGGLGRFKKAAAAAGVGAIGIGVQWLASKGWNGNQEGTTLALVSLATFLVGLLDNGSKVPAR